MQVEFLVVIIHFLVKDDGYTFNQMFSDWIALGIYVVSMLLNDE